MCFGMCSLVWWNFVQKQVLNNTREQKEIKRERGRESKESLKYFKRTEREVKREKVGENLMIAWNSLRERRSKKRGKNLKYFPTYSVGRSTKKGSRAQWEERDKFKENYEYLQECEGK